MALVLALLSAAVYGGAVALQQHEATAVPHELALRPGLLIRLARRPLWMIGMAGDIGGFALQTAALAVGSLVVVQPVLTTNLVFALVLSALLVHRRLSGLQWRASIAVVAGLVVFLLASRPTTRSHAIATVRGWWTVVVSIVGLIAVALLLGLTTSGVRRGVAFGVAAGGAEGIMAVVAKAFGERVGDGVMVAMRSWEPYTVVGCGVLTLLLVQSAYQIGLPMLVLPVHAVVEPLIGVAVGIGLFGERLQLDGVRGPLVIASIVAFGVGLTTLARESGAIGAADNPTRRVP
jgi:drug/metabolite transporter (DMT)-like permease